MKKKYNFKKGHLITASHVSCLMVLFTVLLCSSIPAQTMDEYKITITSRGETEPYNGGFQLTPIDIDLIDEILMMDHVQEVVPVVTKSFGMNFTDDRPFGNFSENPPPMDNQIPGEPPSFDNNLDGAPPEWNGTYPNQDHRETMDDMFDYIIEGITLESLSTYSFYSIPANIVSGRSLQPTDSNIVYIGEDAQNYFNISVGEQITIEGSSFTVIGVFSDVNYSKYVYMNITDARTLLQLQDSEVNTLYVYVDESDSLESVGTAIQTQYTSLSIRYNGSPNSFRPQDQPNQPFDNPKDIGTDLYTPGFEGIMLITIISGFIVYKKLSKRRNSS